MDDELVQLGKVYKSPGFLLLAMASDGSRAGCVGLRELVACDRVEEPTPVLNCVGTPASSLLTGEIRRLFVRPDQRGQETGRRLATRLIEHARTARFDRLVLNTLPTMTTALKLYEDLGFRPSEPHVDEPAEGTLYFSLDLS